MAEGKGIGYLIPLKQNTRKTSIYGLHEYDSAVRGPCGNILCAKARTDGGKYLYSYMAPRKATKEPSYYLERNGKGFSGKDYAEKKESFGTIVLESNRDMDLQTAYDTYSQHWEIELGIRHYKNFLGMDETRVEGNASVFGSEFVDLMGALITSRMMTRMKRAVFWTTTASATSWPTSTAP